MTRDARADIVAEARRALSAVKELRLACSVARFTGRLSPSDHGTIEAHLQVAAMSLFRAMSYAEESRTEAVA